MGGGDLRVALLPHLEQKSPQLYIGFYFIIYWILNIAVSFLKSSLKWFSILYYAEYLIYPMKLPYELYLVGQLN